VPRKRLAELVAFVARREGVRVAEIDIAVVGRREMASLNRRYLGRAGATDVLSFDLSGPGCDGICGQIVVCGEMAAQRASARKCSASAELMLYVLHGLLHIIGYDDSKPRAADTMNARQDELLTAFRAVSFRRRP